MLVHVRGIEALPMEDTTLWESHEMLAGNGVYKHTTIILLKTKIHLKKDTPILIESGLMTTKT